MKLNRLLWRGDCTLMLLELFDFSGEFGLFVFRFLFLFVIFVINKRYMFNFKLEIIKNLILYILNNCIFFDFKGNIKCCEVFIVLIFSV